MWKEEPPIYVKDPTIGVRIINTEPDPELLRNMKHEMKRSKEINWLPFIEALTIGAVIGILYFLL